MPAVTAHYSLSEFLAEHQQRVDRALTQLLNGRPHQQLSLHQAMKYSLLSGGKRVRPILAYAGAASIAPGANPQLLDACACAVECIHAYSLIHDDLPAMDDDDLRRGQPTCHIAFDEATAILAGDALQTLAFDSLLQPTEAQPETLVELFRELSQASGDKGMVAGQAIDIDAVAKQLSLEALETMHLHKTGALIKAAVLMGARATEQASDSQLLALAEYARCVGLAFQVQDDILDVTADTATLGKRQGADEALNKPTYVALLGLDGAKRKASELHDQALAALAQFDANADPLRDLSAYIVQRNH